MAHTPALNFPDVIDRVLVMAVRLHAPDEVDAMHQYARVMLREQIPHVLLVALQRAPLRSPLMSPAPGAI
jgi:hypothetical protein